MFLFAGLDRGRVYKAYERLADVLDEKAGKRMSTTERKRGALSLTLAKDRFRVDLETFNKEGNPRPRPWKLLSEIYD
jgi:hypothetical protein